MVLRTGREEDQNMEPESLRLNINYEKKDFTDKNKSIVYLDYMRVMKCQEEEEQ